MVNPIPFHSHPDGSRHAGETCGTCPPGTELTEYTFDIVAVATFHIGAPDYPTARRAAEGLTEFNVRDNTVSEGHDDPPGLVYSLTYVTPRGKASFVESDPDDASVPTEDHQTFTEPLLDARDSLREALDEADKALGGDSNDAEHDALWSVRETIAGLLGVTTGPPSPYDYDEDEDDSEPAPYDVLARRVELAGLTQDKLRMILVDSGHPAHAADANVLDSRTDLINAIIRAGL